MIRQTIAWRVRKYSVTTIRYTETIEVPIKGFIGLQAHEGDPYAVVKNKFLYKTDMSDVFKPMQESLGGTL